MISICSLCVALVLLSLLIQHVGDESQITGDKSSVKPPANSYKMRVYSLNHSERDPVSIGTFFRFDTRQLPFGYSSLRFGDFKEDTQFTSRYYAGMGLLTGAVGSNASVSIREGNGRLIQEIAYHGQSLIVLGGWQAISRDSTGSVLDYSWGLIEILAHDWKDGSWIPEDGILIEHPKNITITKATIDLIVFEPTGVTDIPELTPLPASVAVAVLILLMRRRLTGRECSRMDLAAA